MSTRNTLRRDILRALGMLVATGSVAASPTPTSSSFGVAALAGKPPADVEGNHIAITSGALNGEESTIKSFDVVDDEITLGAALSGAPASAVTLEISRIIRYSDLNQAIADAIRNVKNYFLDPKTDRTLVVQEEVSGPTVTVVGTAGTTEYRYRVVAKRINTVLSVSQETIITTGNAALDANNKNTITWSAVTGATRYDIYRTIGGSTQGKIVSNTTAVTADDTGLAGGSETDPVANEYTVPSGFKFINDVLVETSDGHFTSLPRLDWELDYKGSSAIIRLTDDSWEEYAGNRILLQGQADPTVLAGDSTSTAVPDEYIIVVASYLLALRFSIGSADAEGWNMRVNEWKARAQEIIANQMIRPTPGSRRVPGS